MAGARSPGDGRLARRIASPSIPTGPRPARVATARRGGEFLRTILKSDPDPSPEGTWLLVRTYIQERDWDRATPLLKVASSYRARYPLEPEPAPYAGEARCEQCHRAVSRAVLASRHATTFARARDLSRVSLPQGPVADPGNPQVMHEFHREGQAIRLETRTGKQILRAVVDYAFGSLDHFTTFVGRDDQDRSVMLRMSAYESSQGLAWEPATGLARQPADDGEYLGFRMVEGDGVQRCLACHTTSFRAVLDQSGPVANDRSIGCERCHGPGGHHMEAVSVGFPDLAIPNPKTASASEINVICAHCHGFPQPDALAANRTNPAWYRFQSVTMTWSRCYTESDGRLSCVTCHDPHRNVETSTALNEAKCLSCHAADPRPATKMVPVRGPDPLTGETTADNSRGSLSRQSGQGLPRVPHATRLAAGHALLQDGSLHPRPRSAVLGESLTGR